MKMKSFHKLIQIITILIPNRHRLLDENLISIRIISFDPQAPDLDLHLFQPVEF